MPTRFKFWNQGNDGNTMGIKVWNMASLRAFARICTGPSVGGGWANLQHYMTAAAAAGGAPPAPYRRRLNVVWLHRTPWGVHRLFDNRILEVTYSGPPLQSGGFSSQAYVIVDPRGFPVMGPHHRRQISVEYIVGGTRDTLVVLP